MKIHCMFLIIALPLLFSCGLGVTTFPLEQLDIFILQTKKDADCIILQYGDKTIIIDTGEEINGPRLVSFLHERNVDTITCLFLTYPDADHIGSARLLIEEFMIGQIVQPVYPYKQEELNALNDLINKKKIPVMYPVKRRYISFQNLRFVIFPPRKKRYKDINNYSLAIQASYGNKRMLFTGDAKDVRLRELMDIEWPNIDLIKIPYHGRAVDSSAEFITKLKADYGVITATQSDSVVRIACANAGTRVFYSGFGDVHFISDGLTLKPINEGF